jgi:hypothetical protein
VTATGVTTEPVSPGRRPVAGPAAGLHGWVNVAVAAVAMSATLPGRTYGPGTGQGAAPG